MASSSSTAGNLPFKADYAKSNRSKCNTTKNAIPVGTLRLATMVKSPKFDGMQPNWNVAMAFLDNKKKTRRKRPQSTDEIDGFDDLRPEDQTRIEGWILAYTGDDDKKKNNDTSKKDEDPAKKLAVREQLSLVWKIRDLTTTASQGKPLPVATIKAILTENQIAMDKGADLVKLLADGIIFGVAPVGNSADGCCATRPLRFCPHTCRYVCQAPQAWGECPYSATVDDTTCKAITIPTDVAKNVIGEAWLKAVQDACGSDKLEPRTRLFIRKTAQVSLVTPATSKRKRAPSNNKPPPKQGKPKPKYSRACVDPDAVGLVNDHHVLDESFESGPSPDFSEAFPIDLYDTVLCRTDLSSGSNSQYKLQIVVRDGIMDGKYHLWRTWGRVGGTGGGGNKDEVYNDRDKAKAEFCKIYLKQTGNNWVHRKTFVKHPGKFFQLDVSYADNEEEANTSVASGQNQAKVLAGDPNSKLDQRVQEVVAAMFDKGIAMSQLKSLEVDLSKMPLAKITEAQLKDAYSALKEIEQVLQQDTTASNATMRTGRLQQLSNQFYSKCPSTNPVLIDSMKLLKHQVEMVDELINLMASKDVMEDDSTTSAGTTMAPVDAAYQRLNTELTPMDPNGEAYAMLKKYVENTRNATVGNSGYNDWGRRGLRLLDAFEVQREGEANRFVPSKALGNRRLLWHGSRISNYSGILGQGLRIAPPEAPVSGYRFGKGVYFADMLGKSANYCRTCGSSEMFIMACDVSLGKTFETPRDMYMEKPQPGSNSTHALSEIIPNPTMSLEMSDSDNNISPCSNGTASKDTDKVLIPMGTPMENKNLPQRPSCDVSEFIVYDQRQVQIRFLLRLTTDPNTKAADGSVGASTSAQKKPTNLFGNVFIGAGAGRSVISQPGPSSRAKAIPIGLFDDSDSDCSTAQPKKKRKRSVASFIRLEREDRSRPSLSGLKLLNCRTFVEGLRLTVVRGDITDAATAAIVIPSNEQLSLTGMVGTAVRQKAGPAFTSEVNVILQGPIAASAAPIQQTSAPNTSQLPINITRLENTGSARTIRDIATAANVAYLTPFYKVTKKEDIQATKDIICLEGTTGYFRGPAARTFLGLAAGKKVSLVPHQIPVDTEIFVQSTSHNRKIPSNSAVLLETSVVAPTAVTAAPPQAPPLQRQRRNLKTSDVCVVKGHNLSASQVIFVVSPIYSQQPSPAAAQKALSLAVKNALRECSRLQLETVTLPSIGSGQAGYDKAKAAGWIIDAIAEYLEEEGSSGKKQSLKEVCFCLFDDESLEAYRLGILARDKKH